MICIIVDFRQSSQPPQNALLANSTEAYVAVRQAIRISLDNQTDLNVYVSDSLVAQWLADLRRYPTNLVIWQQAQSGAAFELLFGASPIAPFTPALLDALDLETLPIPPPHASVDPVGWVLAQRVDPLWSYTTPPAEHLAALIRWVVARPDWSAGLYSPLIAHQLIRWAMVEPRFSAMRVDRLAADTARLLAGSALTHYDRSWLRQQDIEVLPLAQAGLETHMIAALHQRRSIISSYWNNHYAAAPSAQLIDLALAQMSGLSMAEADALKYMLESHPALLGAELMRRIDALFANLPASSNWRTRLREQIAPPVPNLPDAAWDVPRWLRWATDDYMPYFAWVIRTGQPRDHQIACAAPFSDWVYANYQRWINADPSPLVVQQHRRMRELLAADPNCRVVWLVIDGMAWWHGELLRPLCQQRGLYTHEHGAAIAALPSITSIAKRVLTTGVPTADLSQPTVAAAAAAQFARSGIPAQVTYRLPEALQMLEHSKARCVMVLFNTIDDLAHGSQAFTDNAGVRAYLGDLADHLAQARDICARNGQQLHILIGSDHGGTLLPDDAAILPLPVRTQPIEEQPEGETNTTYAVSRSARAATIDDPQQIAPDQRARWYILDRDRFQLDRHYLVPRGYNYIARRPTGWTHGGLTPEEVVVPLLYLTPDAPQIAPVQFLMTGTLLPLRESVVQVRMQNSNRFPLEQLRLEINGNPHAQIDHLGATTSIEVTLTLPAAVTSAAEITVPWRVQYRAFGVEQRDEGRTTLAVRRLSTEDTAIDDMFD